MLACPKSENRAWIPWAGNPENYGEERFSRIVWLFCSNDLFVTKILGFKDRGSEILSKTYLDIWRRGCVAHTGWHKSAATLWPQTNRARGISIVFLYHVCASALDFTHIVPDLPKLGGVRICKADGANAGPALLRRGRPRFFAALLQSATKNST